jgi:hypothetical protein
VAQDDCWYICWYADEESYRSLSEVRVLPGTTYYISPNGALDSLGRLRISCPSSRERPKSNLGPILGRDQREIIQHLDNVGQLVKSMAPGA